jgi:Putative peptidoglycan binding domain
MMTRLIRTLCAVAVVATLVVAVLAIQVGIGQSVAFAQAPCGGTTWHQNGNFGAAIPSTSNNSGNFACIDGPGSQGPAVTQLQQSLNFCRGENLTVDGVYGDLTAAAMKRAQKALGVTQDGVYGPNTRHAGFAFRGAASGINPHVACGSAGF